MVCQVYDLLHLVWKTYHFSGKSKRELHQLGQELGVDVCTPSTVKGTRWIPHVHRALKVFLRHGADKDLATDHGQYSIVLQHMEHLAVAGSVEVQGWAKKVNFTQYMKLKKKMYTCYEKNDFRRPFNQRILLCK